MSQSCDETYAVYAERWVTARKPHECCACEETIPVGNRYCKITGIYDGNAESWKRCARCQAIHKHLRTLGDFDEWPDEELRCGHLYRDVHGCEPPEEIAALAFALPGDVL